MTSPVSRRLAAIEPSATMAISDRARRLVSEGRDVISFGAGEPDFPTPRWIVDAAVAAARDPRNHKYTANAGLPELRQAISEYTAQWSGPSVEANQVLVTNGGKQAVFQTIATLVDQGQEVIIPAPYWVTYPEAVRLAGGRPVPVVAGAGAGYRVTVDQLEAARSPDTKLLIFVSPSNPTGAVYSREETVAIGEWAAEHGIWVLTDEIYQHLVYGDATFSSITEVDDLQWVIVNGVAKTYAMTGWRVGWMVGPVGVVGAAARLQSHLTSNVSNVSQRAALAAITGPMDDVHQMRAAFDARRTVMHQMLDATPGVDAVEPLGAFYCFPDVSDLIGTTIAGRHITSDVELAQALLEEAGVAVVPGEAFGAPGHMRLSYALSQRDLERGLAKVQDLLS